MNKILYFQLGGLTLADDNSYVDGQVILNPRSIKTRNFWDKITPWNTKNEDDLLALYERGFIYRDADGSLRRVKLGSTYKEGENDITDLRSLSDFDSDLKEFNKRAERAARLRAQYGESEGEVSAPGGNVLAQMDRGANYVRITPRTYNVAISKGRMNAAYKALLQSLYDNKNHNVLRQMSLDNKITDDTLKTYLGNNELNAEYLKGLGLNDLQSANILNLMPKDPDNLPVIAAGTVPETFKAADYSAFATGLEANDPNYNSRLYNRVLGYRNAHNLAEDAALPSDLGNLRFYNDYYVHRQGDEDFYSGPTDIYDASGKKRQKTTTILKKGGIMKYFQAGGSVTAEQAQSEMSLEQSKALIAAFSAAASGDIESLAKVFGISTREKLMNFMKLATKISKQDPPKGNAMAKALRDAAASAVPALYKAMGMTMAKQGSKLEYFQRLNGKCPEGYEMKMFKIGGKVCKKCQKIDEACKGKKMEEGGESPIVQQFKNGRKCKK